MLKERGSLTASIKAFHALGKMKFSAPTNEDNLESIFVPRSLSQIHMAYIEPLV